MNIGVVFPQTEFGSDPAAVRDYAQTAEGLGYSHIAAFDHVLGANPNRPGGWRGAYTYQSPFLEPFVLFSYMAGVTSKIGFLPAILILPQRQTALVAKQAATVDVLCRGKLRLGVGNGWNEVEYIGLGQDFHTRGKRMEEQVALLRHLWTQPLVNFSGRWDTIPDAGINPLPVQRPIPIWFGGNSDAVLRRAARMGDGWLPNLRSPDDARPLVEALDRYLAEAGRSRAAFGVEARMAYGDGNPQIWHKTLQNWQSLRVDMMEINTMGSGFRTPEAHVTAIRTFAESLGVASR